MQIKLENIFKLMHLFKNFFVKFFFCFKKEIKLKDVVYSHFKCYFFSEPLTKLTKILNNFFIAKQT